MSDLRPPLLYLVHRIPFPPNKGDKVRSFNILRQLARRHRVFLGTFVDQPEDLAHVPRLSEWCEAVRAVPLHPLRARIASLRGLLSGEALSLPYYRHPDLTRWVDDIVRRQGIRQAVAFSGPMAQYLDLPALERRLIDFCDLDSAKWTAYAGDRRWPLSWLYRREGRRLLDFERRAAAGASASLFVTEAEAALFRAAAGLASPVEVMQNGVDADFFTPEADYARPFASGEETVVFTGAMDYWPNIDAVNWFARELLPAIRRQRPRARFWIVGMNPAPAVQALAGEGVSVTGAVPDVRPYLAHADVVVAPLRIARGIQNKVLEAMAMARPVVASADCATGLTVAAGECEIAHGGEDIVSSIVHLLADDERRIAMGRAARGRVLADYSWQAHLGKLDRILEAQHAETA